MRHEVHCKESLLRTGNTNAFTLTKVLSVLDRVIVCLKLVSYISVSVILCAKINYTSQKLPVPMVDPGFKVFGLDRLTIK